MKPLKAGRTIEVRIVCAAFALLVTCGLAWLARMAGGGWLYILVWIFAAKWALVLVFDMPDARGVR